VAAVGLSRRWLPVADRISVEGCYPGDIFLGLLDLRPRDAARATSPPRLRGSLVLPSSGPLKPDEVAVDYLARDRRCTRPRVG
jgi:hypothetical protein